jgi:hypothetical protein
MDFLKVFPSLILDILSKVIPGALFLAVFQNRYLPPNEIIGRVFDPQTLSAEWQSWYKGAIIFCTAYFIGVFIAIIGNAFEAFLINKLWYPRMSKNPEHFIFVEDQPPTLASSLSSSTNFSLFIDHCRYSVYVNSPTSAVMLEKYRTAFRMFFSLAVLSVAIPASARTEQSMYALLALPLLLVFALHTSKRYLCKSVQLYALAQSSRNEVSASK